MTRAKTARKFPNAPYWVMLRDAEKKILTWAIEQAKNSRDVGRILGVPPSFCARRARVHGLKMSTLPGTPPTIERAADDPDPWPPPAAAPVAAPTEEEPDAVVQPPRDPIS